MNKALVISAWLIAFLAAPAFAQVELVANGDFEDLALDENDVPIVDIYGNVLPSSWFRNLEGHPTIPKTELIGPANGDPADDSDGNGTNSVALNPQTNGADPHSDWRSQSFEVTPGEQLSLSFDFKFLDVVNFLEFQQFRLDLRAFNDPETTSFVNEIQIYVSPVDYRLSGQEIVPSNFNDENWHTLTFDWIVPEGPGGPEVNLYADVRFTINAFTTMAEGQVRFDNISVTRPSTTTGDYNGDGTVNAADYTLWRDTLGQTVAAPGDGADGDSSGMIDQGDYDFWKTNFGSVVPPGAGAIAASVVPEPSTLMLIGIAVITFRPRRRK
jgi:hypothetical protein